MAHFELTVWRDYELPAPVLWSVVSDLAHYADHVEDLDASPVVAGEGLGATRECRTVSGDRWSETVTEWVDGHRFVIDVDTSTYPLRLRLLFRRFRGTWTVDPAASGCRVTLHFEAEVRGGRPAGAVVRALARRTERDLEATLDSYGRAAVVVGR